jgi:hypothetical protein
MLVMNNGVQRMRAVSPPEGMGGTEEEHNISQADFKPNIVQESLLNTTHAELLLPLHREELD